jgi:hypothetical protein
MKSHTLTWTSLAAVGLLLFAALKLAEPGRAADEAKPIPIQSDDDASPSIKPYMHAKLVHAESVLQGLVLQDFDRIARGAEGLRTTSLSSPAPHSADKLNDEVYEHFRLEFLRLSTRLGEMADAKNLDGAAFSWNSLTANCMACHEYLRKESGAGHAPTR